MTEQRKIMIDRLVYYQTCQEFSRDEYTIKSLFILIIYQCGFRKGFDVQHYLIKLLEKRKQSLDNGLVLGALLTDLSKAFDYLSHELLPANLFYIGSKFLL